MTKDSDAPLRGQALAVPVEPASGLAPSGFDPSRVELRGLLSLHGSKRGERYFEIEVPTPYFHSAFITVYGDEGREGDDDLTDDVTPFDRQVATVLCRIDQYGDLTTSPKNMSLAERDTTPNE